VIAPGIPDRMYRQDATRQRRQIVPEVDIKGLYHTIELKFDFNSIDDRWEIKKRTANGAIR
jgi:hypothetical protein